jgi:hypothetical protein
LTGLAFSDLDEGRGAAGGDPGAVDVVVAVVGADSVVGADAVVDVAAGGDSCSGGPVAFSPLQPETNKLNTKRKIRICRVVTIERETFHAAIEYRPS